MLITITLGQLVLLFTCLVIIGVSIYALQTLRNLKTTVAGAVGIISRNEEHISRIMSHVEQIAINAEEVSLALSGREAGSLGPESWSQPDLLASLRELKNAFQEISGMVQTSRKMVKRLFS